jgi:hypothetical protein
MDFILPRVAHGVESVTVQEIQDNLTSLRTGLAIDRNVVMQILDPTKIKLITKVEGDKVYLDVNKVTPEKKNEAEHERQEEHVKDKALGAAKKRMGQ